MKTLQNNFTTPEQSQRLESMFHQTAQRVEYNPAQTTAEPEENTGGNTGGNQGNNEEIG